jgi:hypothetical protein
VARWVVLPSIGPVPGAAFQDVAAEESTEAPAAGQMLRFLQCAGRLDRERAISSPPRIKIPTIENGGALERDGRTGAVLALESSIGGSFAASTSMVWNGPHRTICTGVIRWNRLGLVNRPAVALAGKGGDATHLKAHRTAGSVSKGLLPDISGAPRAHLCCARLFSQCQAAS